MQFEKSKKPFSDHIFLFAIALVAGAISVLVAKTVSYNFFVVLCILLWENLCSKEQEKEIFYGE